MHTSKKKEIRTVGSLSWEEREKMIKEYLSSDQTKSDIWRKYTGQKKEHGQMIVWMRKLGYISEKVSIERNNHPFPSLAVLPSTMDKQTENESSEALQQRIKELEKQLEIAQLKAEGYELMVKLAEQEFKISIKKKFATNRVAWR